MPAGQLLLSAPSRYQRKRTKRVTKKNPLPVKIVRPRTGGPYKGLKNFPKNMLVKCMYYSGNIGTTTTVSLGQNLFEINNAHDFDSTGAGHQPRGYDQWTSLYNRYRVVDIKVTVTAHSTAMSTFGMVFAPSTQTSLTNLTDALEEQRSFSKTTTLGGGARTVSKRIKPWTVESISKAQYMDDSLYAAVVGSEPNTKISCIVFWQNADETTSTNTVVTVTAEMTILFDVPINITSS